jgi:hypothetical protein
MGFSISWLAVRRKTPDVVLHELGLFRTGQLADYPNYPMVGRTLPNSWFLLVADRCDHELVGRNTLVRLSAGCEVVACSIEEHVMVCWSEGWLDGEHTWRLEHDAQRSILDIKSSGSPPGEFTTLATEYANRQRDAGGEKADVDYYFEIPLQTAKSIVGFKHDETTLGVEDGSFEVLIQLSAARQQPERANKPWWRIW